MSYTDADWVAGTMSGTSLDGVDAAMVHTDGVSIGAFGPTHYRPYTATERTTLAAALGLWPGADARISAAAGVVHAAHRAVIQGWTPDLVGFHGQTLAHDPGAGRTHQLGDGTVLARDLGVPVAWDFRSADVAAGGQGAPLAPFFHHACARWVGTQAPVVIVNLGGVGNLTWVDPTQDSPDHPDALLAFDTGPANAPINDLVQTRTGKEYDADGALALQGTPDAAWVRRMLEHPYFFVPPPKSLDRNSFAGMMDVSTMTLPDAAASLVAVAVGAVARGLAWVPSPPQEVWITGGGRRNKAMMLALQAACSVPVRAIEEVGLNGDMLEAQAFAYLAQRVRRGLTLSAPTTTGCPVPCLGGRVSLPPES
ncbi:MAG: anhydro-N-acetylmuramic acid kinase [Paracoccaceae bacterium]